MFPKQCAWQCEVVFSQFSPDGGAYGVGHFAGGQEWAGNCLEETISTLQHAVSSGKRDILKWLPQT